MDLINEIFELSRRLVAGSRFSCHSRRRRFFACISASISEGREGLLILFVGVLLFLIAVCI